MKTAIKASIHGADYTCEIHRDNLKFFEAFYGPAYALLKRISGGFWTVDELRAVINFATKPKLDPNLTAMAVALKQSMYAEHSFIDDAFVARGPAYYAPLAVGILTASLGGVDDELAVFSDADA
ncbi:hypothetical protein [Rhizobium ruizarguesonis]|uniref:hypothetical protein n=1 Tax=Rhizobium ruizarguesonis TaxID=2081791 RepID=UPI001030FE88|nr:hypothetical protein [Rhizobium ruizarguesonis]TAZ76559.1 hypothetical protein ELH68_01650 [Rhizobium ruizarguesonis]TBA03192.1 hypothetical protein ELH64_01635 [Rhizobium ruizarguesonis]